MKPSYKMFFFLLTGLFLIYNFKLYTTQADFGNIQLSDQALKGETIWLKYNCNSCHQLYGLGGYLGPDLTNIYSKRNKDEVYLKHIFNSGIGAMPRFNLNRTEQKQLVAFLKEVNQTGYCPNPAAITNYGAVKLHYKDTLYEK
ncbi:MAG: cytochrome c [Flavobacteriaceae bacterium]|nr:cytochrome c [Bacteroidota bacterium]